VNEGGIGIQDLLIPGQTVYTISVAEKGVLWLRMVAHGEAGHGSTPMEGRAPGRLIRALNRLAERTAEPVIDPSIYDLAARVADDAGGLTGFVLRRPELFQTFVLGKLMDSPPARATLFDTVNVTGFSGEKEPNVIPSEVSATLDCRLLPGTSAAALDLDLEKTIDDPNVTLEILDAVEAEGNDWNDSFFSALARHAVDHRKGVVAGPAISPGYTDSLFLRRKGVHAFGFTPFEVPQSEMMGFHGKNERVSAMNVRRGLRALFRAVVDVAVAR
jgi:carboxypeptidase PM20D1